MKSFIRRAVERAIKNWDYELKDSAYPPVGLARYAHNLAASGFSPRTVIDVGVGHGTPWLYDAFPVAHFELFEALEEFKSDLQHACSQRDAVYHLVALGSEPGKAEIEVDVSAPTSSTMAGYSLEFLDRWSRGHVATQKRLVDVKMLDEFGPFDGPILLKLDVEGFEGQVIGGAQKTLQSTEMIIVEASIIRRHVQAVSLGDIIALLECAGFRLIDFAELTPLGRGGPLSYVDAVFSKS